jgi:hypothetical protein
MVHAPNQDGKRALPLLRHPAARGERLEPSNVFKNRHRALRQVGVIPRMGSVCMFKRLG